MTVEIVATLVEQLYLRGGIVFNPKVTSRDICKKRPKNRGHRSHMIFDMGAAHYIRV